LVELFSDTQFGCNGKRNAFALRAVTQGSVVDFDIFWHPKKKD
jgi:hypothetical protein